MRGVHLGIGIAAGVTAGVLCVGVLAAVGEDDPAAKVPPPAATPTPSGPAEPRIAAAPYLHLGWGKPPQVAKVMDATGITAFTLAFALSDGGCEVAFDGRRPLAGGPEAAAAQAIKDAGGQVHVSFGGWSGRKLGPLCGSPEDYAAAVQKVVDAYAPTALDFDIENDDELRSAAVQDLILKGMKIVKAANPDIALIITTSTDKKGLDKWGQRLLEHAAALEVPVDNYTVMPFNFGGSADMYADTVAAAEDLKTRLADIHGWDDATAWRMSGVSGMNGVSDDGEITTPQIWTRVRDWASFRGLGRLSFWSVNRDRPCPQGGGDVVSDCGGVPQKRWEFTEITAGFQR
ncbi:chitinase [Actinocorallia sp. A-T 12471]|uniref:chitinase n=1 Tax=Actinocorallia sp. A-T 12471 TaxID=3089813 RepID=UPI0029CD96DB|nr:chitinase [Actinocorallia sp. A-T 12471]MDX6743974.1 chitinase [Actinocorallia sp. A-T 12471]